MRFQNLTPESSRIYCSAGNKPYVKGSFDSIDTGNYGKLPRHSSRILISNQTSNGKLSKYLFIPSSPYNSSLKNKIRVQTISCYGCSNAGKFIFFTKDNSDNPLKIFNLHLVQKLQLFDIFRERHVFKKNKILFDQRQQVQLILLTISSVTQTSVSLLGVEFCTGTTPVPLFLINISRWSPVSSRKIVYNMQLKLGISNCRDRLCIYIYYEYNFRNKQETFS